MLTARARCSGACPRSPPPAGVPPPASVPDLAGARLDLAEHLLDRLGVKHDTSGGGTFGIIDSGNWTVCTTTPASGAALAPRYLGDAVRGPLLLSSSARRPAVRRAGR